VQPLLLRKRNKIYLFWVCVCSLRCLACNAYVPYSHLWPFRLYNIRLHYLTKDMIFAKTLLNIKRVLILSTTFVPNILILEKSSEIWSKTNTSLHVKYPLLLSDFNEFWIFSTDFLKILKYQILWKIRPLRPELFHADRRTNGQTDMAKLIIFFRNFENAPKKGKFTK
jgi:hypothetical protein